MRFSWTFPARREKGPGWYATAGVALTAFVVWGFLMGYPYMSVVAMIFAGVYLFMDNNARGDVAVLVDERGVTVAGALYDYASVAQYSVIYENNRPAVLRLALARRALAQVDVEIPEGVDVAALRTFLSTQVQEGGQTEFTLTEALLRKLKL